MVTNSEPLQRLRTVLRTIGNNSEMDKEDATDVALGLAKLMKSEDESSLICFLCKRKSSNRTKFLLHFRSHFRARKRIPDSDQDHSGTEEEEESLLQEYLRIIVSPSRKKKQLDNNETEDLICLTCLKRFSNCQNLRRHLRLHISRDSITPDIDNDTSSGRYFL
ncbi:unnamed protein product [Lepeophtheirus salmonis]|uniref:(salmon louse) hypothetical protein n=1 Tax=Lepeophtheirus salmonis TaxID=72036 RepID=A0A7R8HEI7_LEPSM|nr:unnamed protein product [Lepeophtheirus salmonis]CAF3029459.1 unnamed protein product [Lepeophtheirus salmonis]